MLGVIASFCAEDIQKPLPLLLIRPEPLFQGLLQAIQETMDGPGVTCHGIQERFAGKHNLFEDGFLVEPVRQGTRDRRKALPLLGWRTKSGVNAG